MDGGREGGREKFYFLIGGTVGNLAVEITEESHENLGLWTQIKRAPQHDYKVENTVVFIH